MKAAALVCWISQFAIIAVGDDRADSFHRGSPSQSQPSVPSEKPAKAAAESTPFVGSRDGQEWSANGLGTKFVWCPPGFVTMGQVEQVVERRIRAKQGKAVDEEDEVEPNPDDVETIVREVTTPVKTYITRGYWLGKYEVTRGEWKQVMQTEPWKGQGDAPEGDLYPASFVNWEDAMAFCRSWTRTEREAGRLPEDWEFTLPTEAQWERACRARSTTKYSFGDDESQYGDYAWYIRNAHEKGEPYPHVVGGKLPNAWGLHDMHGNAWEWCRDWYQEKLPGGRDPEVTQGRGARVYRGGAYGNQPIHSSSSFRYYRPPTFCNGGVGFRAALTAVVANKPAK
ncbi:MAG: formylglycine-generating enzyme family protein [Planctomycetales bacterium]